MRMRVVALPVLLLAAALVFWAVRRAPERATERTAAAPAALASPARSGVEWVEVSALGGAALAPSGRAPCVSLAT